MLKTTFRSFLGRNGAPRPASPAAPDPADAPAPDSRRHPRIDTGFAAVLHAGVRNAPVNVGNLSPGGAMVETSLAPQAGETVVRGGLLAQGTIVWSSVGRCGLEFPVEISVDDWLAPPSNGGQARIDEIIAQMKAGHRAQQERPGRNEARPVTARSTLTDDLHRVCAMLASLRDDLSCSKLTLERHGPMLRHFDQAATTLSDPELLRLSRLQLVDELGAVFQLLVDLEDEFTSSRETVARHGYKLQHLDLAMQMLSELAADLVIGSSGRPSGNPRLENLRIACDKALQPAAETSSVVDPSAP
jgi:hypothetical protein